ncbi:hypothetical protein VP01_1268g1 [Puccinia sorghi]|uniref:Uncharacterized protein n=1 Tax=Puccinia sorghi TaxID=27349 RepID=A0A0L6VPA8_9BASI|nr:hypothetical protein VP01_1268g1 [Puccinia sorghi]
MSEIGPDRDGLIDGAGGAHDQPVEGELEDGRPRLGQTDEQPLEQDPASTPQQPAPALPRRAQQTASRSTPSTSSGPVSQPQRLPSHLPIPPTFQLSITSPVQAENNAQETASSSQTQTHPQPIPPIASSSYSSSFTTQATSHPRPQIDLGRPSKRPRYSLNMDQSNHHNLNISTITSSSIQSPLYSDDDDDEINQKSSSPSSPPRPHSQHQSSPLKSPKTLPQTITTPNQPQDLQSLLKIFSDGLHALAPHLISPQSAKRRPSV